MATDWDVTADQPLADSGVVPGGLKDMVRPGFVTEWDTTANRVRVSVDNGLPQWMPALGGYYAIGQTVFVMRNPLTTKLVLCLGPTLGYPSHVLATLTAINTTTVRADVTWGAASFSIPYIAATYTVGGQVWVLLDPTLFGEPSLVLGPASLPPAPVEQQAPQQAPTAPLTVTRTTTVLPEWSGTYRTDQGRWNQWNVNRNGADALWQGSGYGATGLTGLVTYGNRITDLGATAILSIVATLRGADASAASYPLIAVQGSGHASQPVGAPTSSGDTVTGNPGRAGVDRPFLTTNMCNGFQSGTYKGLRLVGPDYGAVRGTGAPDGMALEITYTTPA